VKTEEMIKRDSSGHLRAHDETKVPEADVRTDLRMRQAYSRRGLALEIADVMTYTCHEALVDKLFMEYQREPPQGYAGVSLKQVADADRRIWKIMAESLAGDIYCMVRWFKLLCKGHVWVLLLDILPPSLPFHRWDLLHLLTIHIWTMLQL